jgi:hypothetical protein
MLRSHISPAAGPIDTTWLQACHFPLPPKNHQPPCFSLSRSSKKKETTETKLLFLSQHLFSSVCRRRRPGSRSKNPPVIFREKQNKEGGGPYI